MSLALHQKVVQLEMRLKEIDEIIEAGRQLGVTNADIITAEEIKQLVADFTPLRVLEMSSEVRVSLIEVLVSKGIDKAIFEKTNS